MNQEELATAVGTTKAAISRYELDQREPKTDVIKRIAAALGVPGAAIMFDDPDNVSLVIDDMKSLYHALQVSEIWAYDLHSSTQTAKSNSTPQALVLTAMDKLNYDGQQKLVERAEELKEIPRYRRQDGPQSTSAPQADTDTTPTTDAPETPPEGE